MIGKIIRFAEINDIPEIMNVLEENLLSNKSHLSKDALEDGGFIVHRFDHNELEKYINNYTENILLVAIEKNKVVGYTLNCDLQALQPKWLETIVTTPEIKKILNTEKVLYCKHIAKKSGKLNVGEKLFRVLFKEAKNRNYQYIVGQIVVKPIHNKLSESFHQKLGGINVGTLKNGDMDVNVYLKKI